MNKILSQALKKAVSEYSPNVNEVTKDKRPDLFSLNNETELFQNDKGIIIKIDRSRDANLTDFGKATLKDRYLGCLLYTSPSPRDLSTSRMPSSA